MEDTRSSSVEGYEEAIEGIDDLGSILDGSELSAARRELGEHARSFADEVEVLLGKQLAVIEQEEARALQLVASLQERAHSLTERERALDGQQESLRAGEAELEERGRRVDDLRSQLASLDERIAHEEELKAERAGETERLAEQARLLAEREQATSEQQERLRASEAELEERRSRLDELRSELASLDERIAHEEELKAERVGETDRQRARGEALLVEQRTLAEQQAELERGRAELEPAKAALAEREAAIAQREAELEAFAKSVAARELLVRRVEPADPAPPDAPGRTFTIDRLERLVSARRDEFPDRVVEWDAYLFELRPQSATDGTLPERLTGLIEEVFAPLL
jgi:DNA repair exonuclease SbcCD ATPase subunit